MAIALQLYTVRHQLAADFRGTLERIRSIGYEAVETYPFPDGVSLAFASDTLKSLGLKVVAMHTDLPLGPVLYSISATAEVLGCDRLIWHGWPRRPEHDTLSGVRSLASLYNEVHAAAGDEGLQFGLHNHWWEFQPLDGIFPCQIFDEQLHPDIFLELDTYWVKTAGLDPAAVIEMLRKRVRLLHLKDGPAIQGAPMTALGEGVLDFESILKSVGKGVDLVVELDECETDIFAAVERSFRYLNRNPSSTP